MGQFDSELEANAARAKLDALSTPRVGPKVLWNIVRSLVQGNPTHAADLLKAVKEGAAAYREERVARDEQESEYLLQAVVLEVGRHDKSLDALRDRMDAVEKRLEDGMNVALGFPTDGSAATLDRLALVVVRGAIDYESNPQAQTNEFLRIAAQITESEVTVLGRMYEFQEGLSRQASHAANQENWLRNVLNGWVNMNRKYRTELQEWMTRKSALVRLESYGFVERIPGNPTGEDNEMGQSPYALLPLGREFYEYIRPPGETN